MTDPRQIISSFDPKATARAVKQWANCRFASVDDSGDIWVADPQRGHYLSEDKLAEFVAWGAKTFARHRR